MTFVVWGSAQWFQSYAPFLKLLNLYKESLCVVAKKLGVYLKSEL